MWATTFSIGAQGLLELYFDSDMDFLLVIHGRLEDTRRYLLAVNCKSFG